MRRSLIRLSDRAILSISVAFLLLMVLVITSACSSAPAASAPTPAVSTPPPAVSAPGVSDKKIVLGAHLALTGPATSVGVGSKTGIEMAVDEINALGGINGRLLEVSFEDDAGTAEGGISAVRRLADQTKVLAVFGAGSSSATVSVVPLVQDAKVPYYVSLASDPRVLNPYSPYVFSGATVQRTDVATVVANFIDKALGAKNVAFLMADEAMCQADIQELTPNFDAMGIKIVATQRFKSGDTDLTGQIEALKRANPQAIRICALTTDGGRLLPQLRRAGLNVPLVADGSLADPNVIKAAGSSSEGLYSFWTPSTQYIDDRTGAMGDWRARFDKKYPAPPAGTPNLFSLMTYGDFYVLAEGLRVGGKDLSRERLVAALETITNFVAGKDGYWKAAPIALPRSFNPGDHKGNKQLQPVVVKSGEFRAVGE